MGIECRWDVSQVSTEEPRDRGSAEREQIKRRGAVSELLRGSFYNLFVVNIGLRDAEYMDKQASKPWHDRDLATKIMEWQS